MGMNYVIATCSVTVTDFSFCLFDREMCVLGGSP